MKSKIVVLMMLVALFGQSVKAQWVVTDPLNLAQGILNTAKEIVETSTTAYVGSASSQVTAPCGRGARFFTVPSATGKSEVRRR